MSPGRARARPCEVLLVFPPLNVLVTHPELGIPQLTAWLRREGIGVTAIDLNAEIVGRYLRDPAERLAVLAATSSTNIARLLFECDALRVQVQQLRRRLCGGAAPLELHQADDLIRRLTVHMNVVLGAPLGRPAGGDATDSTPQAVGRRISSLLQDATLSPLVWHRFLEMIRREWFEPRTFFGDDLAERIERPCPGFDRFLARHLEPHLDPGLRVLGLSVHGTPHLVPALGLARWVHARRPDLHITLGGPWAMVAREVLTIDPLLFRYVESVIPWEGELPLTELVGALRRRGSLRGVPGLMRERNGRAVQTPPPAPVPLGRLPVPDFSPLDFSLYPEKKVPFRTIRGCYWGRCVFCYHVLGDEDGPCAGTGREGMSREHLAAILELARTAHGRHGANWLTLADNATPPGHLAAVAEGLRRIGAPVQWKAMVRFDPALTPELCARLFSAGCRELTFGLETSDPVQLRKIGKGIDLETVLACLRGCRAAGIGAKVFVLDYPSQPLLTYRETLRFLVEHHDLVVNPIPQRFQLGRNSRAYRDPSRLGLVLGRGHERWFSVFDIPFKAPGWFDEETFRVVTEEQFLELMLRRRLDDGREDVFP
jgi:anaerobic magnesium-protoporphyrin IX monomethyl ester cyclase